MVFVQQSAGRYVLRFYCHFSQAHTPDSIIRAMFEICLKRGWAVPARACLDLCKMVERRMFVYFGEIIDMIN